MVDSYPTQELSILAEASAADESTIGVMHLVDSLAVGGAERVAVNLVNLLSRRRYSPYLCATRCGGPLSQMLLPDVTLLQLERSTSFDGAALRRIVTFIRAHRIRILHAHGTSLFFARAAAALCFIPVVWHDHYGRCELNDRPLWLYRMGVLKIAAVITVNQALANWAHESLRVQPSRIRYIPNLLDFPDTELPSVDLPGDHNYRIVCVANIRPQKDHMTLLRAMVIVRNKLPGIQLLLVGGADDATYLHQVRACISSLGLDNNVSYLGARRDVPAILRSCSIGVLSSASEGLPLALLEYGAAELPVVVTAVGQCPEVVDYGRAGILVPPFNPEKLAEALLSLIGSVERRVALGTEFGKRVRSAYNAGPIMEQICDVYRNVLN